MPNKSLEHYPPKQKMLKSDLPPFFEKLSEIKPPFILVCGDVTRPLKFGDEIQMNFKNV